MTVTYRVDRTTQHKVITGTKISVQMHKGRGTVMIVAALTEVIEEATP